jgi:hypothetical protein
VCHSCRLAGGTRQGNRGFEQRSAADRRRRSKPNAAIPILHPRRRWRSAAHPFGPARSYVPRGDRGRTPRQSPEVRKNAALPSPGDGDDAAGRVVAGGGESRTSPETGTTRLAATSPAEARKRALGGWVLVLGVLAVHEELRGEIGRPEPRRRQGRRGSPRRRWRRRGKNLRVPGVEERGAFGFWLLAAEEGGAGDRGGRS